MVHVAFGLSKLCWNPFSRMSGNAPCLSKPTNIIAGLFLLGALGWIINRVTGPNFRSIVPFSEIGNKALRLFWQVFPNSQKPAPKTITGVSGIGAFSPKIPHKDDSVAEPRSGSTSDGFLTSQSTTQTETPSENRERALISVSSSNEELLQMMIFVQGDDGKLELDLKNHQSQAICKQLGERIRQGFVQHAHEGEDQVARALAPLFALANSDSDRFMILVNLVIGISEYCPRFTVAVLEKIKWPSETLKQKELPACLAVYILDTCLDWQDDFIEIEAPSSNKESTFFPREIARRFLKPIDK
jgi:hypothetical protein